MGAPRRGTCAIGQTIGMHQDTAARARPSKLACHRVLRSSGNIVQIRTKTNGTERVPREPSGNHKRCVQLGTSDDQSRSDADYGHVTFSEFSLISFRKPSRAHRRVQHYVHNPCPFLYIGLHLSARRSIRSAMCRMYSTIHTCAQLSAHIRLYACEPRPIGLHFSRPRPLA